MNAVRPTDIIRRLVQRLGNAHPDITDASFPTDKEPTYALLESGRLERYDAEVSTEAVLSDLAGKGRRAGTAAEVLAYTLAFANRDWRGDRYGDVIAALGQVGPNRDNDDCVVVVIHHPIHGEAGMNYSTGDVWALGVLFLNFPCSP